MPSQALPQLPPKSIPPETTGIAATEEVPFYDELPPSLQREIGPLRVSLHFFSSDPARRMLRINGTIRHEKENITAALSIMEIRETSSLFNYRGTLFELPAPGQ
jgi:general secretion pathway protein B